MLITESTTELGLYWRSQSKPPDKRRQNLAAERAGSPAAGGENLERVAGHRHVTAQERHFQRAGQRRGSRHLHLPESVRRLGIGVRFVDRLQPDAKRRGGAETEVLEHEDFAAGLDEDRAVVRDGVVKHGHGRAADGDLRAGVVGHRAEYVDDAAT